jgi:hypothetical protein
MSEILFARKWGYRIAGEFNFAILISKTASEKNDLLTM